MGKVNKLIFNESSFFTYKTLGGILPEGLREKLSVWLGKAAEVQPPHPHCSGSIEPLVMPLCIEEAMSLAVTSTPENRSSVALQVAASPNGHLGPTQTNACPNALKLKPKPETGNTAICPESLELSLGCGVFLRCWVVNAPSKRRGRHAKATWPHSQN